MSPGLAARAGTNRRLPWEGGEDAVRLMRCAATG